MTSKDNMIDLAKALLNCTDEEMLSSRRSFLKALPVAVGAVLFPKIALSQDLTKEEEEFLTAAEKGRADVVKSLLEKGINVDLQNEHGWTALRLASRKGRIDVVKLLLENGAKVNLQDEYGWTALMMGNDDEGVIRLLLENGADVNLKDKKGRTALDHAKEWSRDKAIELLEKAGAKKGASLNDQPPLGA